MIAMSLVLLVLTLSWTTAHFMARTTAYLIARNNSDRGLLSLISQEFTNGQTLHLTRVTYFILLVFGTGSLLAIANSIDPLYKALLVRVKDLLNYELTHGVITGVINYLILFLGLFLAYHFVLVFNHIFPKLYRWLDTWGRLRFQVVKFQNLELITPDQITDFFLLLARYLRVGVLFLVGSVCLTFIFNSIPWTQGVVNAMGLAILELVSRIGQWAVTHLPNLLTLVVISAVTRYALKFLSFLFRGFRQGKVKVEGFHPELVEPTYQIFRFFILAFALVAAFPYIPGSDSPIFRGLSLFIGFLLSLGSTSLVTNIIAGIVITYTRGLKIGDRVRIGDAVGDVMERSLLVTRVRTIKNVDITIPNGTLLSNHIVNFSAAAEETGVILNTAVTIGYDVPWRLVHHLLIEAALATEHIMDFPEPFVLQTALEDWYVRYELNAYTMKPHRMANIYSDLHQNIQDKFNEGEVEILSPGYTAVRDGQESTIPKDYLPKNYAPPLFQVFSLLTGSSSDNRPSSS